jgi:hypothetical protein
MIGVPVAQKARHLGVSRPENQAAETDRALEVLRQERDREMRGANLKEFLDTSMATIKAAMG